MTFKRAVGVRRNYNRCILSLCFNVMFGSTAKPSAQKFWIFAWNLDMTLEITGAQIINTSFSFFVFLGSNHYHLTPVFLAWSSQKYKRLRENNKGCESQWPRLWGGSPRRPRQRLPTAPSASKYVWREKGTQGAAKTRSEAPEARQLPPHWAGPRLPAGPTPWRGDGHRRAGPAPRASPGGGGAAPCLRGPEARGGQGARVRYRLRAS